MKEVTLLKELTVKKERPKFFSDLIDKYKINPKEYNKYLELASSNYFSEFKKVQEEKGGIDMTYISKRTYGLALSFSKLMKKCIQKV